MDLNQATRLFRIGKVGPRRLVDELLDRLAKSDGNVEWFGDLLERGLNDGLGICANDLIEGRGTEAQLRMLKDRCKTAIRETATERARLTGLAGYFLAEAAARIQFKSSVSTLPRVEVEAILVDLAALTPAPWSDFFLRAVSDSDETD